MSINKIIANKAAPNFAPISQDVLRSLSGTVIESNDEYGDEEDDAIDVDTVDEHEPQDTVDVIPVVTPPAVATPSIEDTPKHSATVTIKMNGSNGETSMQVSFPVIKYEVEGTDTITLIYKTGIKVKFPAFVTMDLLLDDTEYTIVYVGGTGSIGDMRFTAFFLQGKDDGKESDSN
ncbi:MAG: hypothetical protein RR382_00075 [Tannerellaceae bacterium]